MKDQKKQIKKTFTLQHDQSDCAVACLLSIVRYYGGDNSFESLREISGTSVMGTTLLGLSQASKSLGFNFQAFQVDDTDQIKNCTEPCILHVIVDNGLEHYVVLYSYDSSGFLIGDPAKGIMKLSESELLGIWHKRYMLTLKPNESFITKKDTNKNKFSWILQLLTDDAQLLLVIVFLGLVIAVLSLSMPVFFQKLIDDILPHHNLFSLITGLILVTVLQVAKGGLNYLRSVILLKQNVQFNNRMVNKFYALLLSLPKTFFDTRKTGDLISRLNDTARIQQSISFLVGSVIIDFMTVLISLVYVFNFGLMIALCTLASIPLALLLSGAYSGKILKGQTSVMKAFSLNESNYIDSIQGIDVIKISGLEKVFGRVTQKIYGFFQSELYKLGMVKTVLNWWAEVGGALLLMGILSCCSFLVFHHQLKTGELMAIITVTSIIISAVIRLALSNIQLQEAKVAFNRMYEFIALKAEEDNLDLADGYDEQLNTISVADLSFRFAGRPKLLDKVSFEIKRGEILTVWGQTGSGKSTIFQILQKFQFMESGTITANGKNIGDMGMQEWRSKIATVPQNIKIFNCSLFENISLGTNQDGAEKDAEAMQKEFLNVYNFCKHYGFDNYFSRLPQGYNTLIGEDGINLSGGQRQLVAFARALYRQPQLLLLDEATASMDTDAENFIFTLLNYLSDKMLIVMITHNFNLAKKTNAIYNLNTKAYIAEPVLV